MDVETDPRAVDLANASNIFKQTDSTGFWKIGENHTGLAEDPDKYCYEEYVEKRRMDHHG